MRQSKASVGNPSLGPLISEQAFSNLYNAEVGVIQDDLLLYVSEVGLYQELSSQTRKTHKHKERNEIFQHASSAKRKTTCH